MQRSESTLILHIHISTSSQELLYCFDITTANRTMNRSMFAVVFAEEVRNFGFVVEGVDGLI